MTNENASKRVESYSCKYCDYVCSKSYDWYRHVSTRKHKILTNTNKNASKRVKKYDCICGKTYKHASSLCNHRKKCKYDENNISIDSTMNSTIDSTDKSQCMNSIVENEDISYKEMFLELMKKNSEITNIMIEQHKTIQTMVPNINKSKTTTNNTTNNNFNINIFLNEQCKDALNMTEFIESIQLSVEDLTNIGELGQTKGMSNILIDKLNSLDIFKRPIHCSDIKKETIYIKDQDKWSEDTGQKPKLKHALDEIVNKSMYAIPCITEDPDTIVKTMSEVLKDPREDKKIISRIVKGICL